MARVVFHDSGGGSDRLCLTQHSNNNNNNYAYKKIHRGKEKRRKRAGHMNFFFFFFIVHTHTHIHERIASGSFQDVCVCCVCRVETAKKRRRRRVGWRSCWARPQYRWTCSLLSYSLITQASIVATTPAATKNEIKERTKHKPTRKNAI